MNAISNDADKSALTPAINDPHFAVHEPIQVAGASIRRDAQGRYSFNDLHKAAVAAGHEYKSCQVEHFTRNEATTALIDELRKNGELEIDPFVSTAGRYGGTWGCKELVYAYAMWVSPAFHLKVIRAYDAQVTAVRQPALPQNYIEALEHLLDAKKSEQRALTLASERAILIEQQKPAVEFVERFVDAKDGSYGIREMSQILHAGQNKFSDWLEDTVVMYRKGANPEKGRKGVLTPYSEFMRYFDVDVGVSKVNGRAFSIARFNPAGAKWISERWNRRDQKAIIATAALPVPY